MAKDPAFLMYSKDWIEETADLTPEEKGVLITLRCFQHQRGGLPNDMTRLSIMVGLPADQFNRIWQAISSKFDVVDNLLVDRSLLATMTERLTKSKINTISGTFAGLLRQGKFDDEERQYLKNHFKVDEFFSIERERLTERLTKWIDQWLDKRLKSIGDGNEINSMDIEEKGVQGEKKKKELNIPFEIFWSMYDKKEDKIKCAEKWDRLTDAERDACIYNLPAYVASTPDKAYRKNPARYLSNKSWNNEIIPRNGKHNGNNGATGFEIADIMARKHGINSPERQGQHIQRQEG